LADADDDLEGVAEGVRVRDEEREEEADGAPGELVLSLSVIGLGIMVGEWMVEKRWEKQGRGRQTAVTVSMQRTKGSEVRYLESESAYSFHNCPKRSCAGPI
jgi:hypothetical protein